ncbi:unnamed protein product, partial [Prorocentrum cordatum]
MAAEHCAKGLHTKVLGRLAKLEGPSCSTGDIRRALSGSLCDLNGELIQSQPGLEGCGAAVALVAGRTVFLAVAGQSGATLCGQDPRASAEASAAASREGAKRKWTGSQVRALNPEAVAAAARRASGLPEPAPVAGARPARAASIQRLQAKNPTRRLGSSAASAGLFGGKKAGALDPTAVKNAQSVAVDKGAGGLFTADDMRVEVVALSADDHALLLLGNEALYRGSQPLELALAASAHARDPAAASAAAAKLAHGHLVHKASDDATWVQNERSHGNEVVCVSVTMVWNEPPLPGPRPAPAAAKVPEHLRPSVAAPAKRELTAELGPEEAAMKATMSAFYAEQAKRQKLDRGKRDEPTAIGPLTAEGSGATQLKHVGEGKIFGMADLDGTSQWRVRMAKATHMRGGDDDEIQRGGDKGGKGGKGKGKGKKGKGKKGKGKGKKGKAKGKGGDSDDEGMCDAGDEAEEGDFEGGGEDPASPPRAGAGGRCLPSSVVVGMLGSTFCGERADAGLKSGVSLYRRNVQNQS